MALLDVTSVKWFVLGVHFKLSRSSERLIWWTWYTATITWVPIPPKCDMSATHSLGIVIRASSFLTYPNWSTAATCVFTVVIRKRSTRTSFRWRLQILYMVPNHILFAVHQIKFIYNHNYGSRAVVPRQLIDEDPGMIQMMLAPQSSIQWALKRRVSPDPHNDATN